MSHNWSHFHLSLSTTMIISIRAICVILHKHMVKLGCMHKAFLHLLDHKIRRLGILENNKLRRSN